ncbi:exodeoxyribonuclease III [Clostridiales bacterium S5-A14a]|nr:exodeoxyribonuclease III [Clostridiales bacterium S5-A14a]
MKLVSWNVNGLRAALKKGFIESMRELDPDIIGIQETKMQPGQAEVDLPEYEEYFNSAIRKGYSGTAVFSKHKPINVTHNFGEYDDEGRTLVCEFEDFYFVTVYTPNSKRELERLDYRMDWEDAFKEYMLELDKKKPVIICGDLNVAHKEIDLKNPKTNRRNAGFTDEERDKFGKLLDAGFTDTFRHLYPDQEGIYSWWSYRFNARKNNAGWRIDYFLVSDRIADKIKDAKIHTDIMGSDHCPVSLEIDI